MDTHDAQRLHELAPALAALRLGISAAQIGHELHQRFLDEPRDHAGVGATAAHRRRATGVGSLLGQNAFAQRIVGAHHVLALEIEAGPGLDHGVDVKNAKLTAELHHIKRGDIHRQVDAKALTVGKDLAQNLAVILRRQANLKMADPVLREEVVALGAGVDHDQLGGVIIEMTFDQRQGCLADRAEADDRDGAVDAAVGGIGLVGLRSHGSDLLFVGSRPENGGP